MTDPLRPPLAERFGAAPELADPADRPALWTAMAGRGSCRSFTDQPVDRAVIETLCALSLCAPTKSDLQQRDIVIIADPKVRAALDALMTEGPLAQPWIADAPHLLVFCGNNRRQRLIHQWRDRPFVNDHLDAFFNAAVDAGIALSAFVLAAEAYGLGCCPISAIRNEAAAVSELIGLPDHMFPVAGLALGHPRTPPLPSPRLPLAATVHTDRYAEHDLRTVIADYDARREAIRPYGTRRLVDVYGQGEFYGWSEDKARQYSRPERERFGAFVRSRGFKLD